MSRRLLHYNVEQTAVPHTSPSHRGLLRLHWDDGTVDEIDVSGKSGEEIRGLARRYWREVSHSE